MNSMRTIRFQLDESLAVKVSNLPCHDISIRTSPRSDLAAFGLPPVQFKPVCRVADGASVNCDLLNDYCVHSCGTHTEWVGHINADATPITQALVNMPALMIAQVITVEPERLDTIMDASEIHAPQLASDRVLSLQSIRAAVEYQLRQQQAAGGWPDNLQSHRRALIIRTVPPNQRQSLTAVNHSGTNPPYLHYAAAEYIATICRHLLVDLPSVDREQDGGRLMAHRALLLDHPPLPETGSNSLQTVESRTITELCSIGEQVKDGYYMLNLQVMPMESDAAPSRPGFAGIGPVCLQFPLSPILVNDVKDRVHKATGLPTCTQKLTLNSRYLQDSEEISVENDTTAPLVLHLKLSLPGGKGGFGANLKRLGGRMSRKGASNYEACRDLNGRRLRTLHDAQKLADYLENEPEREKEKNERLLKKIKEGLEVEVEKRVIFNDTAYFERKEQMVEDVKDAVAKVMANGGPIKNGPTTSSSLPPLSLADPSKATPQADPLGLWNDLSSSDDDDDNPDESPSKKRKID